MSSPSAEHGNYAAAFAELPLHRGSLYDVIKCLGNLGILQGVPTSAHTSSVTAPNGNTYGLTFTSGKTGIYIRTTVAYGQKLTEAGWLYDTFNQEDGSYPLVGGTVHCYPKGDIRATSKDPTVALRRIGEFAEMWAQAPVSDRARGKLDPKTCSFREHPKGPHVVTSPLPDIPVYS